MVFWVVVVVGCFSGWWVWGVVVCVWVGFGWLCLFVGKDLLLRWIGVGWLLWCVGFIYVGFVYSVDCICGWCLFLVLFVGFVGYCLCDGLILDGDCGLFGLLFLFG